MMQWFVGKQYTTKSKTEGKEQKVMGGGGGRVKIIIIRRNEEKYSEKGKYEF